MIASTRGCAYKNAVLLFERRWAQVILDSFAPSEGPGLAPRPGEVDLLATFDRLRRGGSFQARVALRAAVWLIASAPLWLFAAGRGFASLTRPERQKVLETLLAHRVFFIREATFLMKTVASLALFESEPVRARSGYDGAAPLVRLGGPR